MMIDYLSVSTCIDTVYKTSAGYYLIDVALKLGYDRCNDACANLVILKKADDKAVLCMDDSSRLRAMQ